MGVDMVKDVEEALVETAREVREAVIMGWKSSTIYWNTPDEYHIE